MSAAQSWGGRAGAGIPRGVKLLIIANVAVYLLIQVLLHYGSEDLAGWLYFNGALFPQMVAHGKVWQIFTYMFLHDLSSPMHILFNMFGLWMFGRIFEPHWGFRRFLRFYFLCGVGGAVASMLAYLVFGGDFAAPIVGASAAVLGLLIAFSVTFPEQYIYLYFAIPVKARYIGIGVVVIDILSNFLSDARIASQAHLGGMATAYLLLTGFWKPSRLRHFFDKLKAQREYRERRKRFFDAMKQ